MTRFLYRYRLIVALLISVAPLVAVGQAPNGTKAPATDAPDLSEYRTADQAVALRINLAPPTGARSPGYLGVHVKNDGSALTVSEIQPGSPAAQAGVRTGDVLVKVDGAVLSGPDALREVVQSKAAGEKLSLTLRRGEEALDVTVTLAATSRPMTGESGGTVGKGGGKKGGKGFQEVALPPWKKEVYRLAVVIVEFPDIKHNEKITPVDWEHALFSRNFFNKTNATGQAVYGSLNDYYQEQSYGKFSIEGKVFAPVLVSKKRAEYAPGNGTGIANKTAVLTEAMGKLEAREAKDAFKDFDGLCFIYAGSRVQTNRGNLYYPHRGSITFQNKRWSYCLCPEGGTKMETISVFALEFGKLLGLPELAARTENAGSEGLGVWCLMSDGAGQNGKPMHLSAWCKEQLGWLTPTVVDPTTRQKLILGPVQNSPKECLKVMVRLDGSEYFLLENRTAKGFDSGLPAQGLLIWRVSGGRPTLEESHGVTGPTGPRVHLNAVPYPSKANNAFTPITTPSSRSVNGGGLPVHITNIRRLADGRITLFLGYEYH
ncbi:MAG TPA: M6 family metalloprotease domain-containing protein [Gemmataceae bacterium]|nr:M6 family metalloprotease domain-containing protein [Gemmataceae bacterium]